jgi:hypothetical protein
MPSTTFAERAGQRCSASTISSPLRKPQTSMTSAPSSGPSASEPLARRDHEVGHVHAAVAERRAADRRRPVGGDARLQAGEGEIVAKALACRERSGIEHGAARAILAPREPGERALRLVALHRAMRLDHCLLDLAVLGLELFRLRCGAAL